VRRPEPGPKKRKRPGKSHPDKPSQPSSKPTQKPTPYSEPAEKSLAAAQTRIVQLEKEVAQYQTSSHPSDLLRLRVAEQGLVQFKSRVHRLKRDLARHIEHRKRYQESRATLTGRYSKATDTADVASSSPEPATQVETVHSDQCLHCGAKASMRIDTAKSTQQCVKCFREEPCFDVVHTEGDRAKTSKQNHYYPASQWDNALNYAQGMRCGTVPPDIIDKVTETLDTKYGYNMENRKDIPHTLIDEILKKMGYKKRSKQKILCWCIITGRKPERLTIEEYIEADKYAQVYFHHIIPVIKELNLSHRLNRKNRLSYDYLPRQIFTLLARTKDPRYERHVKWYKLLQSNEKNWVQDLIWRRVCDKTGWTFIPAMAE
jgi:hypothetical protein